ncbi:MULTISPECIES: contractile injection system protein, VgrG/Pvc8 family [Moraxella]|nr:contractile injection system protein, VgrG/Pvc8 family [Moraxella catarrhalis]
MQMDYERITQLQAQGKTMLYAGLDFVSVATGRIKDELERAYPHPRWQLVINGIDVSTGVNSRLISLTLTDNRGLEADTLEVSLSDHDGALEIPPKGAVIELYLGWHTTGLVYKGMYIVNEIEHSGAPDVLSITAMSADLKTSLTTKKERSFDQKTLGDIISQIAHEHSLEMRIADELSEKFIYHVDQNESDINLLTRLAEEFDATASIKDDILLFTPIGKHKTVSGKDLPHVIINRKLGDRHRYSETHEVITGVRTYFYDTAKKEKVPILAGDETDTVREIRYVHRDQASATDTAVSAYRKAQRAIAHLSYSLAMGDALLIPEMPVLVYGLKPTIDAMDWTLTNVVHNLDDNGYTTDIELERTLGEISEIMPPIRIGEPKDKPEAKPTDSAEASGPKAKSAKARQVRQVKKQSRKK